MVRSRLLVAAAVAAVSIAPLALAQQTGASKSRPAAWKAPHNAFGQPDLGGFWSNATITPTTRVASFGTRSTYTPEEVRALEGAQQASIAKGNERIDNTKPLTDGVIIARGGVGITGNYDRGFFDPGSAVMRVHGEPRNSLLTTPNGQVPARKGATPAAAPARAAIAGRGAATAPARGGTAPARGVYENPESLGLGDRCLVSFGRNAGPPMFPNGFYNNNYQISQGRDSVAILTEMVHDTRIVRLNARHRTDGVRPWFGDSIGRYEGETLVVETTNIPQNQAYNGSWQTLTVTEKFTRVARDRLLYQFTIHDPSMWDADWGGEYEFALLPSGQRVEEYACHEGNYAMEGILAGARDAEVKARQAAAPKAR
jgi:hypothetical protein